LSSKQSVSAPLTALLLPLRRVAHVKPAAARVVAATIVLTAILAVSQAQPMQAGPGIAPAVPSSLLPTDVGAGVETNHPVTITFAASMDRTSVERGLALIPSEATTFTWSSDGRVLTIRAARRWRTDQRYLVVVPAQARTAPGGRCAGQSGTASRPRLRRPSRTLPSSLPGSTIEASPPSRSRSQTIRSSPSRRLTPAPL